MGWMMPAETARQERLWMAFPREGYTLGRDGESAELARRTWAAWERSEACMRFPASTITATKAQDSAMVRAAARCRRSGVSCTVVRAISAVPAGPRRSPPGRRPG